MRSPGEVNRAILQAAESLARVDEQGQRRGGTLRELGVQARVGSAAALMTVKNMCRAGTLEPIAKRRVAYRNKPVAEYAPKVRDPEAPAPFVDLGSALALWTQRA